MLVGRDEERAILDSALEDARRGRSRVLVLTGEAGIGKSVLLDYARQQATGMRTLAIAGVESESDLPYAAIHALLLPVLDEIGALPERQRVALSTALSLGEPSEPDRLAASAGLLTLLGAVAEAQPLLVLVDDAHWLDSESASLLAFVARRVAGEDLAILAAVRDGETSALDIAALPTHTGPPLTEEESLSLLRDRHGEVLAGRAARSLATAASGNPLALIELPSTLSDDQLGGRSELDEPLPIAERIEQAFLRRTADLPEYVRAALLVAAAGADVPIAAVRAGAAAIGGGELETAEAAGLIRLEGDRVRFTHPLLRSAVYQAADGPSRRRAHLVLADALEAEPHQRAWHLAAGAEGPDEATAAALEEAADDAIAHGGYAARARALERAADLSPDPNERARRMGEAARASFWAGDGARAIALCERALPLVRDPLVRADLIRERASTGGWHDQALSWQELENEAAKVEPLDPERAAPLLVLVFGHHWGSLRFRDGLAVADRLEPFVDRLGAWWRPRAIGVLAEAHLAVGDVARAATFHDELAEDPVAAASYFQALVWGERYDDARRALLESLALGRADGNVVRVIWAQGGAAILELALGELERAKSLASEALTLTEAIDVGFLAAFNLITLATIDAYQGRAAQCRVRITEASVKREQMDEDMRLSTRVALGMLASGEGRYDEAISELEPVHRSVAESGLVEPSLFPYQADLIEAYVRVGRTPDALAVLELFESQARRMDRRWALAAAARCRGLLAEPEHIDQAFATALEHHESVPSQLERARTELAYGERLRRLNRRRDARPHLRAALDAFEDAGAVPWRDRAHAELRATGVRVLRRAPDAKEELTPQELQIATLVAEGKTNREIGAQIFLSPKTVEFHLTRVYRKLDLHSRAELIRRFPADKSGFVATLTDG